MVEPNLDALLTTPEAARMLRLSARTLERRRLAGAEPRYVALGHAIRYRQSDLIDWIERSARRSTSEPPPMTRAMVRTRRECWPRAPIDFGAIARAGLARLPDLLARWLPGGRIEGTEYIALNPRRADHRPGSFKINLNTGEWADFAIDGARGRDVVSLAAYLGDIGQVEATERLAAMLGIGARDAR